MKRFFKSVLVAAGITLAFSVNSGAAGRSLKIGYFDPNVVIAQSQWGKRISDDLKQKHEKLADIFRQKNQEYVSAKEDYFKKKEAMDGKARDRKEKELLDMGNDLQKLYSESESKWTEERNAAMGPLSKKIIEIANKIAKEDKYDFIFDKGAIIVPNGKDDITSLITGELDKSSSK